MLERTTATSERFSRPADTITQLTRATVILNLQQASYQGLAENLAAFYAKAGKASPRSLGVAPVLCFCLRL